MAQQSLLDDTAAALIPQRPTLKKLRESAAGCKACPLWKSGAQSVFGEGLVRSEVMFVGEQPQHRGEPVPSDLAPVVIATVNPSAILRSDDRDMEFAAFVSDLKSVGAHL